MDPTLVKQLLLGAVPPLVLGVIVFGLIWRARSRDLVTRALADAASRDERQQCGDHVSDQGSRRWHDVVLVLCVAAAFLGVYPIVFGKVQAWPGLSGDGAMFWVGVIAVAAGIAACIVPRRHAVWGVVAPALAVCCWLSFRRQWFGDNFSESTWLIAGFLGVGILLTSGLMMLGWMGRIAGVWSGVLAVGLCAQVLVVCLASLKHGQGAGAMASLLTFAMVMVLLRPTRALGGPTMITVGLILTTQLMQAAHFGRGELPFLMVGLASIGPLLGAIGLCLTSRRRGLASVLIPILATVLPGLAAVGTGAYLSLQADKASGAADYEY
jgi:hypothetical protein